MSQILRITGPFGEKLDFSVPWDFDIQRDQRDSDL